MRTKEGRENRSEEIKTKDQKIFEALNSMPWIVNKKVRKDYDRIYQAIIKELSV